jgi:hypothetical protein
MRFSSIYILTLLAAVSITARAEPVIEKVDITSDGHIEIYGSGFTAKKQAEPLYWFDFTPRPKSLSRVFLDLSKLNGNSITQLVEGVDNKVLSFDAQVGRAWGPSSGLEFNSDKLYVNMRRYYDFDITDPERWSSSGGLNLKVIRLWAGFTAPNTNNIYLGYQGKEGVVSGRIVGEFTDKKTNWVSRTAPHKSFEWVNEELIYKTSDINIANGVFQYIQNGTFAKSEGEMNRTSERPLRYKMLFLDQVSNYNKAKPLEVFYDDIYIDETYHRVVLTDSASSDKYSRAVVQIPVVWRDNYIKARLRDVSKNAVYLYVFNESNQSNKKGVRVCPKCPEPPVTN